MQPRISELEASLVFQSLLVTKNLLEDKQKYTKELDREVSILKQWRIVEPYKVCCELGYPEKKQELEDLKRKSLDAYCWLSTLDTLIKKYTAIAEGEPHDEDIES